MQTITEGQTPKESYFRRRAESYREQLTNAEVNLNARKADAEQCRQFGKPVPRDLQDRIEYWSRKVRECRNEMQRALFNAGRA